MKIAVISMIRSAWGGSEELWAACATEALKNGHQVYLSAYDCGEVHPKIQQLIDQGLIVTYRKKVLPPDVGFLRKLWVLGYYYILHRVKGAFSKVLNHRPDIVVYNGTCYSIEEDKRLLQELSPGNARFFIIGQLNYDICRPLNDESAQIIRKAYSMASKVFFVSQRNMDTARRHLAQDINNGMLIRNPVNLEDISSIPYPAGDTVNFAIVGNLVTKHKGQDIVLAVLGKPEWQHRNWHLNIYGNGIDEQYLKDLCLYYGLQERVSFRGRVKDIRAIWAVNHLLLMPSLMEGMPLAVVEAMLCARACVVTDVGGHKEWIDDELEGFIAEAASVNSVGNAMEKAWHVKNRWEDMGIAAHQKALTLYDKHPGVILLKLLLETGK